MAATGDMCLKNSLRATVVFVLHFLTFGMGCHGSSSGFTQSATRAVQIRELSRSRYLHRARLTFGAFVVGNLRGGCQGESGEVRRYKAKTHGGSEDDAQALQMQRSGQQEDEGSMEGEGENICKLRKFPAHYGRHEVVCIDDPELFWMLMDELKSEYNSSVGTEGFWQNRGMILEAFRSGGHMESPGDSDRAKLKLYGVQLCETDSMFQQSSGNDAIFVPLNGLPNPLYLLPCFCVVDTNRPGTVEIIWTAERARRRGIASALIEALNITQVNEPLPASLAFWTKVLPVGNQDCEGEGRSAGPWILANTEKSGVMMKGWKYKKAKLLRNSFLYTDHSKMLALKLKGQEGPTQERQKFLLCYPYAHTHQDAYEATFIDELSAIGMKFRKDKTTYNGHDALRILITDSRVDIGQILSLLPASGFDQGT